MSNFDQELKKFGPVIRFLCNLALVGKKVEVRGKENFVKEGPNIIIGNHIGSFKDGAILFKCIPRSIFFTANKMIFTKKEFDALVLRHLRTHLKNFGLFVNLMLNPLKSLFVNYISSNIAKIGTIPVDLYHKKGEAIELCKEYLRKGRAIIALQGRGRVMPHDPNPYVRTFSRGTSVIAHGLQVEENISVAFTPLAIFGTHTAFLVPGKIRVNVGKPLYIADYLNGELSESVEWFRNILENKVKALLLEAIRT